MSKSHTLSGVIIGVALAGALGAAPLPVRLLVIPVCGGAALLPDLDHRSSKIARSLGPITKLLARGFNSLCLTIYHATRTDLDNADRRDGHRTFSHTAPGCLVFGLGVMAVELAGPAVVSAAGWPPQLTGFPVAVVLAVMFGLMGSGLRVGGWGFSVAGGVAAWWVTTAFPAWWPVWPLAVTVGSLAHLAGDACTVSGVPLCWPVIVQGRRWYPVTTPSTFSTGSMTETTVVTPLLWLGLALTVGAVTGVLPVVVGAVSVVLGG